MGLGVALLQGFGNYSFQVKDPQQFVTQIVGAQGMYHSTEIEGRLRAILLSKLQDLLWDPARTEKMSIAARQYAVDHLVWRDIVTPLDAVVRRHYDAARPQLTQETVRA
jgi:membrane protease subunit (stomatin/prohibitin family)